MISLFNISITCGFLYSLYLSPSNILKAFEAPISILITFLLQAVDIPVFPIVN
jgi:hypothetical protein